MPISRPPLRLLDFPGLVEALRDTYRRGIDTYDRRLLVEPLPNGEQNDWLLQPAWQYGRNFGIKLVSIFPGNEAKGVNTILGAYVLFDGGTGMPQLVVDGVGITLAQDRGEFGACGRLSRAARTRRRC